MKLLRRFATTIAVVVFASLLWLAYYAYQDGFTKSWRKRIVEEFARYDLNISFDRLTLDPVQGLVANNVLLLERASKQEVARISKARLDLDLASFFRKERFLERIELESAYVSLPHWSGDDRRERLRLTDINTTVLLPPGRVEFARAEADFYGLRVRLSGSVLHQNDRSATPLFDWPASKIEAAQPLLEGLVTHLERLSLPESAPRPTLNFQISGDLANLDSLSVEAQLEARDFRYADFDCRQLHAETTLTRSAIHLKHLLLVDQQGRLDLNGHFPMDDSKEAQLSLDSTMDLGEFLPLVAPDLPLWRWCELPGTQKVSLNGSVQLGEEFTWKAPPIDIVGRLETDGIRIGEEGFEGLSGDFHIQGPRFFARNVSLKHAQGESSGKFMSSPEEGVRYEFEVGMAPTLLKELPLNPGLEAFLDRWEFRPSSGVQLSLKGERTGQDTVTWEHNGKATLTLCRFETAEIDELRLEFQLNPHAYHFSNAQAQLAPDESLGYSGGTVKAQRISVSARDHLTMLTNVTGYVDPGQVVRCFSPKTADQLDRFSFTRPPEIRIPQGTLDPKGVAQTNLQLELKSSGTMTTEVLGRQLPLDQPRFGMGFHKDNLIVRADHAGLFEGNLSGNVDIRKLTSDQTYSANLKIDDVDFSKLGKLYFPRYTSGGRFRTQMSWRGQGSALESVEGQGVVSIREPEKLNIPIFGPLASLLSITALQSKIDTQTISQISSRFTLGNGALTLDPFVASLKALTIEGTGDGDLKTEEVDLKVALTAKGVGKRPLGVLYGILGTYQCRGTLEEPKWRRQGGIGKDSISKAARLLDELEQQLPFDTGEIFRQPPAEKDGKD